MKQLGRLLMLMHNKEKELEIVRRKGNHLLKNLELYHDEVIPDDSEVFTKVAEFQTEALLLTEMISNYETLIENNDDFIKAEILNLN